MKIAVLALGIGLSLGSAKPLTLWPTEALPNHGRHLASSYVTNSRLSSVYSAHYFDTDDTIYSNIGVGTEIEFGIPSYQDADILDQRTCTLKEGNPIVPATLREKYSDALRMFHCLTDDNEELNIIIETGKPDGLSASFFDKERRSFYVDSAVNGSNVYMIYDSELAARQGIPPQFGDSLWNYASLYRSPRDLLLEKKDIGNSADVAYKFILAPLANKEYSSFHGDTIASVLQQIIICFTRVNGVYLHEFSFFLELHESTDLGICLSSDDSESCDLSNNYNIAYEAMEALEARGIDSDTYDMGHALSTGSGGVVMMLGSVCDPSLKAAGTTGLPQPLTDVYFVDYVAHEIGHQLHGEHSYRDCRGRFDGQRSNNAGVETGGGNSIMGYAGICDNNIQANSDAYFNSINLQQMHEYVAALVESEESCGTAIELVKELPTITVPETCSVPVGSFFQLKGTTTSSSSDNSFFSWDRVDTAFESFSSETLGKFRSWKPSHSQSRFFPNLFHLNFPNEDFARVELLPAETRTMDFRFTERGLFQSEIIAEDFSAVLAGDFVFSDTIVSFVDLEPLSITNPVPGEFFLPGQSVSVTWEGIAQEGLTVQVLFAVNNMIDKDSFSFDYTMDNIDLDWELLGEGTIEDGQLEVNIPDVSTQVANGNLMVRATLDSDMESCFFFDLVTGLRVSSGPIRTTTSSSDSNRKAEIAIGFLSVIAFGLAVTFGVLRRKNYIADQVPSEVFIPSETDMKEPVKKAPEGRVATKNRMFSEDSIDF